MQTDTLADLDQQIADQLKNVRSAVRKMLSLDDREINSILNELADLTLENIPFLLEENQKDLDRMDPEDPKYDRLLLNPKRLESIAADLRKVAELPSPLGQILEERTLPNGLELSRLSVPMGVIGIVFESRPNVTFDVFALCLKSGNASVLKGSRDAHFSNIAIVSLIHRVLAKRELADICYLAPSQREALGHILQAVDYVDLIIPRGSQGLINFVRANAKVPVIETGAGIVHTYFDASADLAKGKAIVTNAKSRRVSVCNALDTLVIHRSRLNDLPEILSELDTTHQCEVRADEAAYRVLQGKYSDQLLHPAEEADFGTEFLSMKMSVKTVDSLQEALDHIDRYSSKHSEAILAEDQQIVDTFLRSVDAAVVYANTTTAFTDGSQFGLGAEIGISTQKMHARGPMALRELTSYKWVIRGDGQIRAGS
ncbi:glutamate-5-semialdehyde dehydrogenase [Flavilitoribacter nigricans]|uniref:Gamma-glutamyl phosphate reductase n=1 Tax=Flavilitoribacter nigricans (strain ATCC 23147 / DSM 23189 / NBRC 102662 / NCIMB 1420 / SS-2) TaxID=1122177 RepID=A0A2D0N6L2_FLAN2|nr:glutamate-5-semialdehyde dehydrogenase [Flavilitoribacter nigricans]PHN04134.1 glutamate-5-semialdehyde dehydrogenase [Flavilitoribacter nigricans DSM 23189 = NBRC 102662]